MAHNMPMGMRFALLHRSYMKQMDARLQEKGLTGVQFGVLSQLRRLRCSGLEEVNQRDLETAMHVTHPTMTEIVKRLEKQGFVTCAPSERDRRFKSIRATEKAAALHEEIKELDGAIFTELSRGLGAEDVDALRRITDRMLDNIFESCGKNKGGEADRA